MTITYKYNPDQQYVLTKVAGQIGLSDVLDYFDKLINDPLLSNPFFEIVDFSEAQNFDFGYYQTNLLIDKLKYLESLNFYQGTILIADRDLIRGMTNIFRIVGEDRMLIIKVVNSLGDALKEINSDLN